MGARAAARARRSAAGRACPPGDLGSERVGAVGGEGRGARGDELLGGVDDLQRAGLALLARGAPGGDAVTAEDAADGLGVGAGHLGDVQAELEPGTAPRHPDDAVAEALAGQGLAVGGSGQGDAGVGVEVVDVRGVDEAVHGGVDARCGTALAVEAVVEGGDHLVLALDPGVDVRQGAQAVQAQDGEVLLGEGAEVAAGALDPEQLDRLTGDGVGLGALGGGVAAGVVGVARVGAETVGAGDELGGGGVTGVLSWGRALVRWGLEGAPSARAQAPQPAWVPPTRSAAIFSW